MQIWSVYMKEPTSYSMAYQSNGTEDEFKARANYAKRLRTMGPKGYDVWLTRWDGVNGEPEVLIEGPGWRDPSSPSGTNRYKKP